MTKPYVSIHGNRLGLRGDGLLEVDGRIFKGGAVPTLGRDIFVDSVTGADTSDGLTPDSAVATLDAAFNLCTANKGYQVFVLPLHAETVTGAAGIAHDVAGVSVYGLGHGGQRPTFLMDAGTAVTYKITANDALVSNLLFKSGHNGVITCIDVQTATDAWLDNLEFADNTTNEHFLTCIKSGTSTENQCDGLKITNCKWFSVDTGSLEFYEMLGDVARLVFQGNNTRTLGTASPAIFVTTGDSIQDCTITGNWHQSAMNAGDLFIDNDQSDNTGIIANNFVAHLDTGAAIIVDCDGVFQFENYSNSVVTTSGVLMPAVDSIT